MSYISERLINWHKNYGRHNLPWQKTRDPYAVWVSEIMLQQTQVTTAIKYYQKFMNYFPTVSDLAKANEEEVMKLWAGLGYYARARNLYKSAIIISDKYKGEFPNSIENLITLPGIGRSTVGAICAFSFGQSKPILDGNVKRVLMRFYGIKEKLGSSKVEKYLWELAESNLPKFNIETYTQSLMDLGATICKRKNAECLICPLNKNCQSNLNDLVDTIPLPKIKKNIPTKEIFTLIIENKKKLLFFKKPSIGIWGGLWAFPEFDKLPPTKKWLNKNLNTKKHIVRSEGEFIAKFTHFKLRIFYQHILLPDPIIIDYSKELYWINRTKITDSAIPTPIKKMINEITFS